MGDVEITTAVEAEAALATPVAAVAPVAAKVAPEVAPVAAIRSNLTPRDPAEEYATAARDKAVLALATRYEEDGNAEAAVKLRAKFDL